MPSDQSPGFSLASADVPSAIELHGERYPEVSDEDEASAEAIAGDQPELSPLEQAIAVLDRSFKHISR